MISVSVSVVQLVGFTLFTLLVVVVEQVLLYVLSKSTLRRVGWLEDWRKRVELVNDRRDTDFREWQEHVDKMLDVELQEWTEDVDLHDDRISRLERLTAGFQFPPPPPSSQDDDRDAKLIEACNLVCHYVQRNIAAGHRLVLEMGDTSHGCDLSLFNEDDDEINLSGVDCGQSAIVAACEDSAKAKGRQ